MRVIFLLFITITTPFVIFIASILYGGLSSTTLKSELSESGIYQKVATLIDEPNIEEILTASYIQGKAEKAVDDSSSWITGKSINPPVLSFKDIKEKFLAANPDIKNSLTQIANTPIEDSSIPSQENGQDPQAMVKSLVKNDFSFPLNGSLIGLKQGYTVISILLPILILLMALSLFGITMRSHGTKSKLRWIGFTFIFSAVSGFGVFIVFQFAIFMVLKIMAENSNAVVTALYPVAGNMLTLFVNRNREFQTTFSLIAGVIGVVCIALSFVFKQSVANKPLTQQKRKKTT